MTHGRPRLIIDESNFEKASLAATLPLPGAIMVWGLGVIEKNPANPLEELTRQAAAAISGIDIEGWLDRGDFEFEDGERESLGNAVPEHIAWCCLIRAAAFHDWLDLRREMSPILEALVQCQEGTELFGACLADAELALEAGKAPILAEDLSDALRQCLAALGHPPLIFVEIHRKGEDDLEGFCVSGEEILELVNKRAAVPPLLFALLSCGYVDPYKDLLLERREKTFSDVEATMREMGFEDPGGFRRMRPAEYLGMFLAHIVRAQAIQFQVALEDQPIERLEQIEELMTHPVTIAEDGLTFVFDPDQSELLRNAPDGYVGQPRGVPLFGAEVMKHMDDVAHLPAKEVLSQIEDILPPDLANGTFGELQDRLRLSMAALRRTDAKAYLASLGWELDIEGFDPETPARHLDFLGYIEERPVFAHAAGTHPFDWDDPALIWTLEELEDEFEGDDVAEDPILLAMWPLFQLQNDPSTKTLKRIVIQGGWAVQDGAWRPFVLSRQGSGALNSGAGILESDRLPKAFFSRHGHDKTGMDILKTLACMRYAALPAEVQGLVSNPNRDSFTILGSSSGWMSLADEGRTKEMRDLFG